MPRSAKKLTPLPKLKQKLWDFFSKCRRLAYAQPNGLVRCVSCTEIRHWKDMDAGHYHPGSTSLALFFDERNVHPQCTACNRWRHGNLAQYALALRKMYGPTILEDLESIRHSIDKISRGEYEEKIEKYKMLLRELMSKQGG